jgi:hypothetical protein
VEVNSGQETITCCNNLKCSVENLSVTKLIGLHRTYVLFNDAASTSSYTASNEQLETDTKDAATASFAVLCGLEGRQQSKRPLSLDSQCSSRF